jgi:hypothetical protein
MDTFVKSDDAADPGGGSGDPRRSLADDGISAPAVDGQMPLVHAEWPERPMTHSTWRLRR